jgi:DNA-directed RNA polymerase specialized sigma24 family protein
MVDSGVPATVEELHARYDRLILSVIQRTNRSLSEDEIQDFRQTVYLRILKYDFLGKCRAYYATHEGKFATSLWRLVRNVVYQRHEQNRSDPLAYAVGLSDPPVPASDRVLVRRPPASAGLPSVRSPERAVEARDILAQIGARLASPKRRTQVSDLLGAAVETGLHSGRLARVLGANPSTVRYYLVAVRAEARRLEKPCPSSVTTKSARKSASRGSASKSPSGRRTETPAPSV